MESPAGETPAPAAEDVVVELFDASAGYAVHRPHGAANSLVTWTMSGAGALRVGGAQTPAEPGDLVVLGPGVAHDYAVADDAEHWGFWWAHVVARPDWSTWLRPYEVGPGLHAVRDVPLDVCARISAQFRRVHADVRWSLAGPAPAEVRASARTSRPAVAGSRVTGEVGRSGIEAILLLAAGARASADRAVQISGDARVRSVEATIVADPAAGHTVQSLARSVQLSPSRLSHLFATTTGGTVMDAVRDARLYQAARLLEMSDLDIGRIATASGFASQFHFSRLFHRRFGVPPTQYRARFRAGPGRR